MISVDEMQNNSVFITMGDSNANTKDKNKQRQNKLCNLWQHIKKALYNNKVTTNVIVKRNPQIILYLYPKILIKV